MSDPRIGSHYCKTVAALYRHFRAACPDTSAQHALIWAKYMRRERSFWRAFEANGRAPVGLDASEDLDCGFSKASQGDSQFYTSRCGNVCILLARVFDEDYRDGFLKTQWEFVSWHTFSRGESDYLSAPDARRGHRDVLSANVRETFNDVREYARNRGAARHAAWLTARDSVAAQLSESTDESRYPEGFLCAVYYRTGPRTWERCGDVDSCWGFVDCQIEAWAFADHGVDRTVRAARKLARGWRAARAFAGVES
jgi:hypothetical protein